MSPLRPSPELIDPNERLRQLKIELTQQEARLSHIGKQRDGLKTDIDDLQKTVEEVKKALADYGGGLKQLETTLQALQYFFDQKQKMVIAAIGDKREPIDDRIREYDHETDRMWHRLAELNEELAAALTESGEADQIQVAKQNDYDYLKGYLAALQAKLQELDGLRTEITKADDATDVASMYFLVGEFKHVLEHTHVKSQHHLAAELKEALSELEAAKEHARSRKAAWDSLKDDYTAHKATLDVRVENRRQKLLDTIYGLFPVATAAHE